MSRKHGGDGNIEDAQRALDPHPDLEAEARSNARDKEARRYGQERRLRNTP